MPPRARGCRQFDLGAHRTWDHHARSGRCKPGLSLRSRSSSTKRTGTRTWPRVRFDRRRTGSRLPGRTHACAACATRLAEGLGGPFHLQGRTRTAELHPDGIDSDPTDIRGGCFPASSSLRADRLTLPARLAVAGALPGQEGPACTRGLRRHGRPLRRALLGPVGASGVERNRRGR